MFRYEQEAKTFCEAIKTFAANPDNLDNFEDYLARHFDAWLNRYANCPENISAEMKNFAEMK